MIKRLKEVFKQKPEYHSDFGGFWIDRVDEGFNFEKEVQRRSLEGQRENLKHFRDKGYLIIKNAVSPELVEQIKKDVHAYADHPGKYVIRKQGKYFAPEDIGSLDDKHRIIDLYGVSPAARQAIFSPAISEFLNALFDEPAIAMQSLSFEYGSEQAIHQDTAYVVSREPMKLAASWIALEDVRKGSGELIYYPGSHRFPDYKFGGSSKSWKESRDGKEDHQRFLRLLHERAEERGIESERFLPQAGDVLIWHADLAHGGAKIDNWEWTRRSLVTHYVPQSVKPNYLKFKDAEAHYHELDHNGNYFTSRHYDLSKMDESGAGKVFYDAGVSKRRKDNAQKS